MSFGGLAPDGGPAPALFLVANLLLVVGGLAVFPAVDNPGFWGLFLLNVLVMVPLLVVQPDDSEKPVPLAFAFLAAGLVAGMISLAANVGKAEASEGVRTLLLWTWYLALFLAGNRLLSMNRTLRGFVWVLLGAAGLLGLWAVYQVGNLEDMRREVMANAVSTEEAQRLLGFVNARRGSSTFLTANLFAGWLLLVVPLGAALAISTVRERHEASGVARVLGIAGAAATIAALALTRSLGAWLSLAVAGSLCFRKPLRNSLGRRGLAIAAAVAAVAIVWILASRRETLLAWSAAGSSVRLHAYDLLSSLRYAWREGVLGFVGSGPGSFRSTYPAYRHPEASELGYSHVWALQLLCEGGIPLLVAWGAAFWQVLRTEEESLWSSALRTSVAASLLHGLFDVDACMPEVGGLLFLFAGALAARVDTPSPALLRPLLGRIVGRVDGGFRIGVVAACALATVPAAVVLLEGMAIDQADLHQNPSEARQEEPYLRRALRFDPWHARVHDRLGAALWNRADREPTPEPLQQEAAQELERAEALDPRNPYVAHRLADCWKALGDLGRARAYARIAMERYPANEEFRKAYEELREKP